MRPASKAASGRVRLNVLAEVGVRRFAEAVDGKTSPLAEVDLVGIKLEDLLLGQALLHEHSQEGLLQLAAPDAPRREEKAARQLHGESAAALHLLIGADVSHGGAGNAEQIHAVVGEETMILRGHDRVHQHFGEVLETHQPALGAVGVKQRGNDLGFQFVGF